MHLCTRTNPHEARPLAASPSTGTMAKSGTSGRCRLGTPVLKTTRTSPGQCGKTLMSGVTRERRTPRHCWTWAIPRPTSAPTARGAATLLAVAAVSTVDNVGANLSAPFPIVGWLGSVEGSG